ncbi:hypothetical protein CEE44_00025 [Candidatus Woesearchaeota archaeon B3_Woes]|nr:MAG: hypothetical protein CEE44_00025 [Candidatus Woesearchaeota archaeon B3_Woes]
MFEGYTYKDKELGKIDLKNFKGFNVKKIKFWLDFNNPSEEDIKKISEFVELHPITIEDLKDEEETTRIKYEEFDDYSFIVYTGIKKISKDDLELYTVYFIVGKRFLITLHKDNKIINDLKKRDRRKKFLLSRGTDYLLHYFIDKEIDLYYPIVENHEKAIEKLDKDILKSRDKKKLDDLFDKKVINSELKSLIVSSGRMMSRVTKPSNRDIREEVVIYFKDVLDNLLIINDSLQTTKEQIAATISEHNTLLSSNMNEAIKVLTIIATIMMPLTLITGIYGMNLPILPGGQSKESFYLIMGIMLSVAAVMIYYFKRKKWV